MAAKISEPDTISGFLIEHQGFAGSASPRGYTSMWKVPIYYLFFMQNNVVSVGHGFSAGAKKGCHVAYFLKGKMMENINHQRSNYNLLEVNATNPGGQIEMSPETENSPISATILNSLANVETHPVAEQPNLPTLDLGFPGLADVGLLHLAGMANLHALNLNFDDGQKPS